MERQVTNKQSFDYWIEDQFLYGGQKYAHSEEREATDVLFDMHGFTWLIGTIDKYTFRFKTCEREKDLLKIACYMFILWLKKGFHLDLKALGIKNQVIVDTNVKTKTEKFGEFLNFIKGYKEIYKVEDFDLLGNVKEKTNIIEENRIHISSILQKWSQKTFSDIHEEEIAKIYIFCNEIWDEKFKDNAGADADTWNK